jgi:NIMA-interacting peptidyl-prolyl cis-trans isomerase 1
MLLTPFALHAGRPEKGHIKLLHESISRQHAALVHHKDGRWYLIDLKSGACVRKNAIRIVSGRHLSLDPVAATGSFVNNKQLPPYTAVEIPVNSSIKFGKSFKYFNLRQGDAPFASLGDETERQAKKKRADDEDRDSFVSANKRAKTDAPTQVQASHILVKHRESRNPSSWREARITRSKEEAIAILKGYIDLIQQGKQTFEQVAKQFSDCSSAKRGGDLGPFKRGEMQAEFENVAFVNSLVFIHVWIE